MVDRALKQIDSVTTPTGTATNIVSMREEFIFQNAPRFVPNVYEGIGMKYDSEWHEITLVFDSDTDIFDAYIDDNGANPVVPSLVITLTFIIVATEVEVVRTWTYTPNQIYVSDRREGRIQEDQERQTFEYHLIAYGDKTVA